MLQVRMREGDPVNLMLGQAVVEAELSAFAERNVKKLEENKRAA